MSEVRFKNSGDLRVNAGIKRAKVTLTIKWKADSILMGQFALSEFSVSADDGSKSWTRDFSQTSGSVSRSFDVSASQNSENSYDLNWKTLIAGFRFDTTPDSVSDSRLEFNDDAGGVNKDRAIVTLSYEVKERYDGSTAPEVPDEGRGPDTYTPSGITSCPLPTPWENILPTCGLPPTGSSSNDGLQISKTGQNQITLNLKNYANKLVTLKITHQQSSSWVQSFDFNIPNCSDISPIAGGTPYSRPGYSNGNITGTNIFYVYNIDGGDYNYVFNHSSIPGPRPTRVNYTLNCSLSCSIREDGGTDCVEICTCDPFTETWGGAWPYCQSGVAISKNGGSKVQWQYEDGSGGNYDDQYVTVEVISTRSAIGATGSICTSALKGSVWISDPSQAGAVGNCIGEYREHGEKIRFRIPSLRASKTSLPNPVCYSSFRGIAGAAPPGEELGSLNAEYSVLHLFDDDFGSTTSLVTGSGIVVIPKNEDDPSPNTNPGTLDRKHYVVSFTDGTLVDPSASNITIALGQNLTAGGINADITVYKKEQASANSLRVWFYTSHQEQTSTTDDIVHVFDDVLDVTNGELSELDWPDITVIPQSEDDPGNETVGYESLNDSGKKHYLITFKDSTIVDTDGSNIFIEINQNKTASGESQPISVSKKEKVDDKNLKVWFTSYNITKPAGLELDNSFVRDWGVQRIRPVDYSGNVFARNWYLSKSV